MEYKIFISCYVYIHLRPEQARNLCLDNTTVCSLLSCFSYNTKGAMHFSLSLEKALLPLKVYSARENCSFPSFTWSWMAYMVWRLFLPRIFLPTGCDVKVCNSLTGDNFSIFHSWWEGTGGIIPLAFSPEQSCWRSHRTPTQIRPFPSLHTGS